MLKSKNTQLGPNKQYVALVDWSSVGNFLLLKAAADTYMAGDRNQEIVLSNITVPQRKVIRAV